MPISDIGAISFATIRSEFGGTGAVSLSQYYRGGGRVPNEVFCHNNTIPASGAINFGGFRGTTNGNTFFNRTTSGSFTYNPPANTIRAQVRIVGGGGGGAAQTGRVFSAGQGAVASGGAGGYTLVQFSVFQRLGQYLTGSVGGGGSGQSTTGGGKTSTGGTGGQSNAQAKNSAGSNIATASANGGTGGRVQNFSIPTAGSGGSGSTRNGGNGSTATSGSLGSISRNGGTVNSDGVGGGAGGAASATSGSPSASNGSVGRIQIRT